MSDTASNIDLITFGCRLNTYESEVMRSHAAAAGLDQGKTIIVNTCAVTAAAEADARRAIRRARRDNPDARIIVTGCAAQISPDSFAAMPEIDHVIGNDEKLKAETYHQLDTKLIVNDIAAARETAGHLVTGIEFEGRARAFLQVQNGCDHYCTFCIIPYGRGASRSVPVGEIVRQAQILTASGYREIVITGVDVTSYGGDLPGTPGLGQMLRRLLTLVPDIARLRLSSLDPAAIDEDLWDLIAHEPRLMPHLHLSLQAGDDMVLKRMKRRHSRDDVFRLADRARNLRSDIAFGADIIAGFPTESDEMFANTLKLVEQAELSWLHVFPYSEREGTPAARMPPVPTHIRRDRAALLRAAGDKNAGLFMDRLIGREVEILVERGNQGHTPHFARVAFDGDLEVGSLARLRVTSRDGDKLKGIAC